MSRPILFLDFDGVLHPLDCRPDHHFCRLPLLAGWLTDERPDVDVVISSNWHLAYDLARLRSFFPDALRSRIFGAAPDEAVVNPDELGSWARQHPRQGVAMAWLRWAYGNGDHPWAALDDWQEGFVRGQGRLVLVDGHSGLQADDLSRVSRVLR